MMYPFKISVSSIVGMLSLYILSSCAYSSKATRHLFNKAKTQVYDMIIVPGIPLEDGKWSRTMKGRILWATYLYHQGIAKNIMFSGSAVSTPYNEALVMGLYALALNVPKEHVFAETTAEHSTENIYYSYYLARKLGFKKMALASDPFQTKSLRTFTRKKVSASVALIPMVIDTIKTIDAIPDPTIDITKAFVPDFIPLKKKYGFFKRIRGTLGYGIKKVNEEDK